MVALATMGAGRRVEDQGSENLVGLLTLQWNLLSPSAPTGTPSPFTSWTSTCSLVPSGTDVKCCCVDFSRWCASANRTNERPRTALDRALKVPPAQGTEHLMQREEARWLLDKDSLMLQRAVLTCR